MGVISDVNFMLTDGKVLRLSSRLTMLVNFLAFLFLKLPVVVSLTASAYINFQQSLWYLLFLPAAAFVLFYPFPKTVHLTEQSLIISGIWRDLSVRRDDVVSVSCGLNWSQVRIRFCKKTIFGKSIVFVPPMNFGRPWKHPNYLLLQEWLKN